MSLNHTQVIIEAPAPFGFDPNKNLHAATMADPGIRPAVVAALRTFNERVAKLKLLRSFFKYHTARAELAAEGFVLTDIQAACFETSDALEGEKAEAQKILYEQMRARLASDIKPHLDRARRVIVAELQTDLKKLSATDEVLAKYSAPPSPLKSALENALERETANMAKPFDLSWHYDMRIALSQVLFPAHAGIDPIELDPPAITGTSNAVATPAGVSATASVGTVRTAAEIAAARAA
jgi:hypothetical protein